MLRLPWAPVYALYAAHYIALKAPHWVSVDEIAKAALIPPRYGSKILQDLRRAGILEGQRGRGYRLAVPRDTLSARRILEETGGPGWRGPTPCPMRTESCDVRPDCVLASAWQRGIQALLTELESITLNRLPSLPDGTPRCPLADARREAAGDPLTS